ncbi:hypothetical protein CKO44_14955 [Rubrivivax gelatinosus]|uniref:DUF3106 domain-containing protein n=1 Tax=Rubrivivax gelatinosus TaxID=28068 RepID=UPI001907983C|nr:hypothetical protein [Rubrivivax gelatinosus]
MILRPVAFAALILSAALAASVPARAAESGPTWSQLTPAQKQALAPLQKDWPAIDPTGKDRWLTVAARFPKMGEAERKRVQERMAAWTRLSPSERAQARLQFQQARQYSAEDRQARWEAYQALPDDQRKKLAERATPKQRAASGPRDDDDGKPKRNIVAPLRKQQVKAVAPAVIQAAPGATTTLMSSPPSSPAYHQSGMPKIIATDGFVNPQTLLPRRGPQGAAVRSQAASEPR